MPTENRVPVADERIGIITDGTGVSGLGHDGERSRSAVPPTVAECYSAAAQARSSGSFYSRTVSNRLGSVVGAVGMRLGIHPTYLTLVNLVLGIGGSVAVMAGRSPDRTAPLLVAGVVLWQVAYIFDCADGQVARATGKTSSYGEFVDVFVDVAVQISVVAAVSSVMLSRHEIPALLVVLFVSAWSSNLNFVNNFLGRLHNQASHSLIGEYSGLVSVMVETLRDYGFVIFVLGAWLLASPSTLFIPMMVVTANNLVLLAGYIARAAYRSIRASAATDKALRGS